LAKDDGTDFTHDDDCLLDTEAAQSVSSWPDGGGATGWYFTDADADGVADIPALQFRAGTHTSGTHEVTFGTTIDYSVEELITADISGTDINEIHLLTGGSHGTGEASYTIVIDYTSATDETFTIPIANDTNATRSKSGSGDQGGTYTVELSTSYSGGSDCDGGSGYVDEIVILPSSPTADVTNITINWPDPDEGGSPDPNLSGLLAVSLEIDQTSYDGLFDYKGTYETDDNDTTDPALDLCSGDNCESVNALWYEAAWYQTLNTGQVRVTANCGVDDDNDHTVTWATPDDYGFPVIDATDGDTVTVDIDNAGASCAGDHGKYKIELMTYYDGTGPVVTDFTVRYDS
ncbi:MAG: hypothetical protein HN348_36405, partial [Proteobacteria bacterium]|nr:hypothetical protein [Pseudomonadota bacterium]